MKIINMYPCILTSRDNIWIYVDPPNGSLFNDWNRCPAWYYSFPHIPPLGLDPYLIMLNGKKGGTKYHFINFLNDSTWDWTWFPGPLAYANHYANCCLYITGPLVEWVVFANVQEHRGSIPGWVILKTQKWYLTLACWKLNIIR